MFGKLLPRETSFFDFFEQHAKLTIEGAKEFLSLANTGANIEAKAKRIKELEHETDTITHRCIEALHKTFITPIERDDIHRLITRMDDIMDFIEAASERLVLYEITDLTTALRDFADVLVRATEELGRCLGGLRNMKHADAILKSCIEVNRLENEADSILRSSLARLYKERKDDPIHVMKWKEIYDYVEQAADSCEDVANIVEGIVLEHA